MPVHSQYRENVLKKIIEYEKEGFFDQDVENDPPTRILRPDEINYTYDKPIQRIKTRFANFIAQNYFDGMIRKKQLIIKNVIGIENYKSVKGGAVLTCNHFHPFDNYAVFKAIQKQLKKEKQDLYKIIREGNYTTFKGIYGYFFRNCNTLPLSSDFKTLRKMMAGVDVLLKRGEKILIYPEQGMWWNYRKPRPLKDGAFTFAVKSDVPVVPFFITMSDSPDILDGDGYPVQELTIHIMPPIYPSHDKKQRDNIAYMKDAVYAGMKEIYERVYGIPLTYACGDCQ